MVNADEGFTDAGAPSCLRVPVVHRYLPRTVYRTGFAEEFRMASADKSDRAVAIHDHYLESRAAILRGVL